jgi:hypothetical protein
MATNVVSLIGTIISTLRDTATITSISHIGTSYTILTSDTGTQQVNDWIKISGIDYKITAMVTNTSFTVTSATNIVGTTWTALAPYYYYGTPIMISNVLDKIADSRNKFPVIVLFEEMPATVNDNEDEVLERTVSCEMYFMDEANYKDWTYDDYYTNILIPMQIVVDAFIAACEANHQIGILSTHNETPHSKWNLTRMDTGKNVFNSQLSGIQLNIDLPILYVPACE